MEKIEEEVKEGFQTVQVQDSFVYKGKVIKLPGTPVYLGNTELDIGNVVLFAKYSPDTQEIEGKKYVKIVDILDVI